MVFAIEGADESTEVRVEWDLSFRVHYNELGLCKERVDPEMSIEIEAPPEAP